MFIHLGQDIVVNENDVIGMFDIEKTSASSLTRDYLSRAGRSLQVVYVTDDLPRSFVVCGNRDEEQQVYISQINVSTLRERKICLNDK